MGGLACVRIFQTAISPVTKGSRGFKFLIHYELSFHKITFVGRHSAVVLGDEHENNKPSHLSNFQNATTSGVNTMDSQWLILLQSIKVYIHPYLFVLYGIISWSSFHFWITHYNKLYAWCKMQKFWFDCLTPNSMHALTLFRLLLIHESSNWSSTQIHFFWLWAIIIIVFWNLLKLFKCKVRRIIFKF